MKAVYKMEVDCGRAGSLDGIFIAEKELVDTMLKEEITVYFGEVLGKHSEIYGAIDKKEIKMASNDSNAIRVIQDLNLESGFNPLHQEYLNFDYDDYGITEEEMYEAETVEDICKLIIKHKK